MNKHNSEKSIVLNSFKRTSKNENTGEKNLSHEITVIILIDEIFLQLLRVSI